MDNNILSPTSLWADYDANAVELKANFLIEMSFAVSVVGIFQRLWDILSPTSLWADYDANAVKLKANFLKYETDGKNVVNFEVYLSCDTDTDKDTPLIYCSIEERRYILLSSPRSFLMKVITLRHILLQMYTQESLGDGWAEFKGLFRFSDSVDEFDFREDKLQWISACTPQAYAKFVTCPVLYLSGTNSNYTSVDRVEKSLAIPMSKFAVNLVV